MKFLSALALAILLTSVNSFATDSTTVKDYKNVVKSEVDSYEEFVKGVKDFENSPKFNQKLLTEELPLDINYGDKNAPVKIVEYASLSCIHCKQFHKDVFYDLKKNYIDTGKVYFTYRHYPLNAPAVKGAMVLDCVAPESKLAFIGALFEAQAEWAYSKSESDLKDKLSTVSKVAGLSQDQFDKCYGDEIKQNVILKNMKRAYDELDVTSTPGIFIQGHRYLASREYATIAKYVDDLIAGKDEPALPAATDPSKISTSGTAAPAAATPPAAETPQKEPAKDSSK